jgi:hypothetical protein
MTDPEAPREPPTDAPASERDRTTANIIVLVVVALLIGVGVWLANTMLDVRKIQDCVASGRRNCAPIATPGRDSFDVPTSTR